MALPHKEIVLPALSATGDGGADGWQGGRYQKLEGHRASRWCRQPGDYAAHVANVRERWEETAAAYEASPDGFFEAYYYLNGHPVFWHFLAGGDPGLPPDHVIRLVDEDGLRAAVDIQVVKINPATERIEDDESLNTAARVWFELGKHGWPPEGHTWHDPELDGGAETYEQAIVLAARRVWDAYGNDRRVADAEE